jgi:hypothetical protein
MFRRRWVVVATALLSGFTLGAVATHWWFNGNTRPWNSSSEIQSVHGESGERLFPHGVVFVSPPVVKFYGRHDSNEALKTTVVVKSTVNGFTWKNIGDSDKSDGALDWNAHGRISKEEAERLGLRWFPISWLQLW